MILWSVAIVSYGTEFDILWTLKYVVSMTTCCSGLTIYPFVHSHQHNLQVGKLSPHLYNSQVKAVTEGEANEQGIYFNIFHYSFLFLGFPVWCMVHGDLTKMLANDKWKVRVLRSLWIYYFALTNNSTFSLFLQHLTQDHRCIIFQKLRSQIHHAFPSSTFDRNIVTGILLLLDLSVHQKKHSFRATTEATSLPVLLFQSSIVSGPSKMGRSLQLMDVMFGSDGL